MTDQGYRWSGSRAFSLEGKLSGNIWIEVCKSLEYLLEQSG